MSSFIKKLRLCRLILLSGHLTSTTLPRQAVTIPTSSVAPGKVTREPLRILLDVLQLSKSSK